MLVNTKVAYQHHEISDFVSDVDKFNFSIFCHEYLVGSEILGFDFIFARSSIIYKN